MCRVAVILLFVEMVLLTDAYAQNQCPAEYTNMSGYSCSYIGDCQDGLPHGSGSEECANGTTYTGDFAYGTRQGKGTAVNDGHRYEGDFEEGQPNGLGTYYYADGSKYEGDFKDGAYSGTGTLLFADGERYEGSFTGGTYSGKGTLYYADGSKYEGDFKDGAYSGTGTLLFADGERYEGSFKGGAFDGQGTYYYADGSKYEGNYKEGQANGLGTYFSANGDRYEGDFKDGAYNGKGTLYYADGSKYEGDFKDGAYSGTGTLLFADGERYEGSFKGGAFDGQGTYYYADGSKYEGDYKEGQANGLGTYFSANGDRYEGDYKEGQKSGRGIVFFANGRRYEGEFKDGAYNGKGTFYYADGSKDEGDFKDDIYIAPGSASLVSKAYLRELGANQDLEIVVDYGYDHAAKELIRQSWEHVSNKSLQMALKKARSAGIIGAYFHDSDIEIWASWHIAYIYSEMKNYQAVREITQPLVDNQKFPPSHQIYYLSIHLEALKEVESISVFFEEFDKALNTLEIRGDIFDIETSELDVSIFFAKIRFIDDEHENAIKLLESWRNHKIPMVRSFVYQAIGDLQQQLNQRRQAYRNYSLALDDASPKRREAILNSMYVAGDSSSYINTGDQLKELSGQNKIEHLMYRFDPNKPEENESVLNELVSITSESIVDDSSALNYLIAMRLKVDSLEYKYSNADKSSEQKIPIDIHKEAFSKFDQDLFKTPNDQVKYIQLLELREDAYWQLEQFDKAIEIALEVLKRGSHEYGKDNNNLLLPVLSRLSIYYGFASRKEEYRGIFDRAISIQLKLLKLGFCDHLNFDPNQALAALGPDELGNYLAQVIDIHIGLSASYSSLEYIYPCRFAAQGLLLAYSYLIESSFANNSKAFQLAQIIRLNRFSSSINLGASKTIIKLPKLQSLANKYASLGLQLDDVLDYDNKPVSGQVTDYRRIAEERDLIAGQLKDGLPQLGRSMSAIPATISEVSKKLQPDQAVVLYYRVTNDSVLAWFISAEDNHLIPISSKYEEVKQNVEVIRKTLEQDGISSILYIKPFALNEAYSLYKTFFEPLEKYLQGYSKVFLVSLDELSTIPFEILPTELPVNPVDSVTDFYLYDDINWLNDKYQFIYPPSINSLLSQSRVVERKSHRYIGVGNPVMNAASSEGNVTRVHSDLTMMGYTNVSPIPFLSNLPQTEQQLRALASQFDVKPDFLLGSDATETMVREILSPEYSVIAFATHGLLDSNISLEPALVLSPPVEFSSLDDGLLTASEISELDLAADVVLLSACNTATPTNARGLNNLAYSFLYAGAHSVIASHWSIEVNATTELLNRFAHHLSEGSGLSVSAAMQHARRDIKKNSRNIVFSHPLFWGPFTIKGLSETYPNAKSFPEEN
jgi:CHAT domain-containing protein